MDQFTWPIGADASKESLGEEGWFEKRYFNLLEDSRLKLGGSINGWVAKHWGKSPFNETKTRIPVNARDEKYARADGSHPKVKQDDNRFERCGDTPQSPYEADKVLGAFWLDVETPVAIAYSTTTVSGRTLDSFKWEAVMYVGDVLGLQADNKIVVYAGKVSSRAALLLLAAAWSRKAKRARWKIGAEAVAYVASSGDTLSGLAQAFLGDGAKWKTLQTFNGANVPDPNKLRAGQRILIPTPLPNSK